MEKMTKTETKELTETTETTVNAQAAPVVESMETLENKIMMPGLFIRRVVSRARNGKEYANYTLNGTFNGRPIHADFEVSKRDTKVVRDRVADVVKGDSVGYETLSVLFGLSDELPLYVSLNSYERDGVKVNSYSYYVGILDKECPSVSLCVKLTPVTSPSKNVAEMLVKKSAIVNKIDLGL